jgi:hypothetical protein
VSTITLSAPGSYTTFPTASITSVYGGSGTTLTVKADVVGVAAPSTPGSGYTTAPAVTFSGGGGSGATGTSTINVTAVAISWGGGGYTAPTITFSAGATGTAAATANVNAGTVMTAGVNPTNCATTFTYCYQIDTATPPEPASPINEIYNSADYLFYSFGNSVSGAVYSQPVTNGVISTSPALYSVPAPGPGTSGIVVDNVSSASQASSIYFGTLGQAIVSSGPVTENVKSATSSGCFNISGDCTNVATVTMTATTVFQVGQTVTIAGVVCGSCSQTFDGNFTILTVSGATITYDTADCVILCFGETATANEGTAEATENTTAYEAIKLTQSGLD